jgi:hypothetical protein
MAKNLMKFAEVNVLISNSLGICDSPGPKVKFLARSRNIPVNIRKSMSCTDTVAGGFWPPCVEHRHGGLRNPLFPAG